jgi:hypothetical protein
MNVNGKRTTVQILPIANLVLDDKNANKGTRRGRQMLEDSLRAKSLGMVFSQR